MLFNVNISILVIYAFYMSAYRNESLYAYSVLSNVLTQLIIKVFQSVPTILCSCYLCLYLHLYLYLLYVI